REGSFGGFYVKVQIIYYTDKQLVRKILNIPILNFQVSVSVFRIIGAYQGTIDATHQCYT
ncbi:hypothetical protein, partial [Prevotella scopos]